MLGHYMYETGLGKVAQKVGKVGFVGDKPKKPGKPECPPCPPCKQVGIGASWGKLRLPLLVLGVGTVGYLIYLRMTKKNKS